MKYFSSLETNKTRGLQMKQKVNNNNNNRRFNVIG